MSTSPTHPLHGKMVLLKPGKWRVGGGDSWVEGKILKVPQHPDCWFRVAIPKAANAEVSVRAGSFRVIGEDDPATSFRGDGPSAFNRVPSTIPSYSPSDDDDSKHKKCHQPPKQAPVLVIFPANRHVSDLFFLPCSSPPPPSYYTFFWPPPLFY